jgi:hypothetical protein
MRGNRIDQNQKLIVEAIRKAGAVWIGTSGDPAIGFDGIVAKAKQIWLVELKNEARPPSARRLTDTEMRRSCQLERVGVTVHVVKNTDEALRLIGAIK